MVIETSISVSFSKPRLLKSLIVGVLLVCSLVAMGTAATVLDASNLQGSTGSKYWTISTPGSYIVSLNPLELYTNNGHAICISASNVILDGNGVKITGPGAPTSPSGGSVYGIRVLNGQNITIKNFNIEKKFYALLYENTRDANCDNLVLNMNRFGIYNLGTRDIQITGCNFSQNSNAGIQSINARNDVVKNSYLSANTNGFYGSGLQNLEMSGNDIIENINSGIWLDNTTLSEIFRNTIINNGYLGIYLGASSENNHIYDNYLKNLDNAGVYSTNLLNYWNVAPQQEENIIGGNYICGNYWNNPTNTGPSELILDIDNDGICDESYTLTTNNVDNYPLHTVNSIKILDESNVQGTTGYQYWDITSPGVYSLEFSGDSFYTNSNYAIRVLSSDVYLNGNNKLITGPAIGNPDPATGPSVYGILVNCGSSSIPGNNITIDNIRVTKKRVGIIFEYVHEGAVRNSDLSNNYYGLYSWKSANIDFSQNTITSNTNGVVLDSHECVSEYHTISENTINSNTGFGIVFWLVCNHNLISNNIITNNQNMGISLSDGGTNNTIDSNTVEGSSNGIYLYKYSNNKIFNNHLAANTNAGIWIDQSNNNQCSGNWVNSSGYVGFYIGHSSSGNSIYNNYFKNVDNEESDGTTPNNQWSINPVTDQNIIGGPKIGGNFWTNPSGSGFSDTQPDGNGDGFCDSAYVHPRGITDNYPLHIVTTPSTVNAEVVSNTIPGTMTGGQAYSVSVTMKNTGTMTWSEAGGIRLGGVGDSSGDAVKFGPDRITIPAGTTVAPGQSYTFSFTMTAPMTGGTYTPQYRMVWDGHQWFGQTLSRTVIVSGGGTVNAEVVSNTIPGTMTGGQAYSVSVTMKNTGTMTWSEAGGIRLGGVGDSSGDAAKFGPTRISIPGGTTVAPGQSYTFTFTMTAPTAYGTYTPQYQMVWDGHQWFGQTLSKAVVVPGTGTVNAEVVSNTIPGTMTGGQAYSVSVTMKNTGTRVWSEADSIRLGGVGDSSGDAAKFGPDRITIPAGTTVVPGQSYTFSFIMTAPGTAKTYYPKYQMVWDGHQWFGQTLSRTVVVQ